MRIQLAIVDPRAPWGQPLFVDGSGRPVYLGKGADGTDDEGEGGTDSGGGDDVDGDDDGDGGGKDDSKKAGAEADAEALRNKIKLADKRAAAAEAKLKQLEDKDKSALEVTERKLTEATEQNARLVADLKAARLENAFLTVNEITWHDPADALTAAQREKLLDGIQDDDGEVDQKKLKAALQALAKAKPHYVKKKDGDEEGDAKGTASKGSTATKTGSSKRTGDAGGPTEAELRGRYAAIRR